MTDQDPDGIDQHAPGAKLDAGKPEVGLITSGMPRALLAVAQVGTFGAIKYTREGWLHVRDGQRRYTDAMLRHHLVEHEVLDHDSGLLHMAQVAWNALARLELFLREQELRNAISHPSLTVRTRSVQTARADHPARPANNPEDGLDTDPRAGAEPYLQHEN